MNRPIALLWAGLLLASHAAIGAEAQAHEDGRLTLAEHGHSDYQVVLPDTFPNPEVSNRLAQTAALVQAAFKANGCDVPVVSEAQRDPAKPGLYLGDTARARACGVAAAELSGWAYALKAAGRDVIIAGNDRSLAVRVDPARATWEDRSSAQVRMGTAKGAADFLREYLGARFLYPTGGPRPLSARAAPTNTLDDTGIEFLKTPAASVPAGLDVRRSPPLLYNACYPLRESFYDIANNLFPQTGTRTGAHSHPEAVPASVYRETHPEYFALVKGRRCCEVKDWTGSWTQQYCLSNPEVQELIYKNLLRWLDCGYEIVGLGQADGFVPCECEACAKLAGTADWGEKIWVLHRRLDRKSTRLNSSH